VSEQNLSDNFFNSEESGVPIPPVEQGWSAMQHMLDKAMPVHTPSSPTAPKPTPKPGVSAVIKGLIKGALISGTAVTVSVSSWWLYKQYQRTKDTHPALIQPAVESPVADSIQLAGDNSYSVIRPSLPDSGQVTDELSAVNPTQTEDHSATNITEGQSGTTTGADSRSLADQEASSGKNEQTIADRKEQRDNTSEGQSPKATGAGRRAPLSQGASNSKIDQTAAAVRASNGAPKTDKTEGSKARSETAANKPSATAEQASIHTKKQAAGNTGRPSRPTTQAPVTASNGSNQTPAGLSSNQQPASTDPVIPSTGQRTPRAGSPQLPGAGKPPAASGANNAAQQPVFAGNYPQKKTAKPKAMSASNNAQATAIPAQEGHLLSSDMNRATSDPSVPVTANRWSLEPVKQPDQSRNIRLLHNSKDRNTLPITAVTRHKREIRSAWNIYGQLPVAVPFEGSTYYFTGPDGKQQYWRLLIHSLRFERAMGKVALSADVMPSINTILPSNEYHSRRAGSSFPQYDTIRSVVKQHGTGFTLQAHYFLTSHLKISAGAQLSLLGKATVSQTLADTLNKRGATILRAATKTETDSLVRSRINGLFEVYYEFGKWQTGVRTIVPFTNTGLQKNWPVKTPVQVELLFRRRLFTR